MDSAITQRTPRRDWLAWLLLLLAIAGWWLSFELSRAGGGSPTPLLNAACGESQSASGADCMAVLRSAWAGVDLIRTERGSLRLSYAVLGMAYFAAFALWLACCGAPRRNRIAWHGPMIALGVGALLQSAYLVHVMANVLHRWCVLCTITHAVNAALVCLFLLAALRSRQTAPTPLRPRAIPALLAAALLALAHAQGAQLAQIQSNAAQYAAAYQRIVADAEFVRWDWQRQPVQAALLTAAESETASAPARVLTAFVDLQCPVCRTLSQTLARVQQTAPVRVEYRHYPLSARCNPRVQREMHPAACDAARAIDMARSIGGDAAADALRSELYRRQSELDRRAFGEWAQLAGVPGPALEEAMQSRLADRIAADVELAQSAGVETVPTLFLDGRKLSYWQQLTDEGWQRLLATE